MHEDDHPSADELAVLAWDAYLHRQWADAAALASRASAAAVSRSRRERQTVEVLCLAVASETARAHDLATEHLAEFPEDELVRRIAVATAARLDH